MRMLWQILKVRTIVTYISMRIAYKKWRKR